MTSEDVPIVSGGMSLLEEQAGSMWVCSLPLAASNTPKAVTVPKPGAFFAA